MSRYCAEPSQGHDQQDETRVQSIHDFPVKAGFTGESDKFRSPSALARANAGFEAMAPCYGWRSPHTRGARGQALRRLGPRRIIPAYAGSTAPVRTGNAVGSDHPRIRGEHDRQRVDRAVDAGSSPHTRGARGADHPADARRRIIPAYAGSTAPSCTTRSRTRDHPRIRGEHARFPIAAKPDNGSSPHTRGAPQARLRRGFRPRIIPAYAGSTVAKIPELKL